MNTPSIYTCDVCSFDSFQRNALMPKIEWLYLKVLWMMRPGETDERSPEITKYEFETLLQTNSSLIARICFSYAIDGEDYKDLYQDVLINLWKGLANFRGEASSSTWIYRVALNTCVSTFRKRKSKPVTGSLDSSVMDIPDDNGYDDKKERLEWLHRMISELSPIDKAIVTMWLDERSYNEIAEVVGMSANSIGIRLHRIKNSWRKKGYQEE